MGVTGSGVDDVELVAQEDTVEVELFDMWEMLRLAGGTGRGCK